VRGQLRFTPFLTRVHPPSYSSILASQQKFTNPEFIFIILKSKDFLRDYASRYIRYHGANHADLHSSAPLQYFDLRSFVLTITVYHSQQLFESLDSRPRFTNQILRLALLANEDDLLRESQLVGLY
jgi:hypothetical protein